MQLTVNLYKALKYQVAKVTLFFFFIYISFGNLFRFIETPFFPDHLIFSEIALYGCALISQFVYPLSRGAYIHLFVLSLSIVGSFVYGTFLHGWDLHAGLYAGRLIALFLSAASIAQVAKEYFKADIHLFLRYLCRAYFVALLLGAGIYTFFSVSEYFWAFLHGFNIVFHGDPHIGRFVSVYFDPNYYAAVAVMPYLMSSFLYKETKKKKYFFLQLLFFLSILLTWSRSGIATMLALSFCLWVKKIKRDSIFSLSSRKVAALFLTFVSFCIVCFLHTEEVLFFLERIFGVSDDTSALSRLHTFQFGISLLQKAPLLGTGYNFLYQACKDTIGINSVDSSLLSILIQFGYIPCLAFVLYLFWWGMTLSRRLFNWNVEVRAYFLTPFFLYGILILFFCSFFNNILFYPFWLLPFLIILFFFSGQKKPPSQFKRAEEEKNVGYRIL